MDRWRDRNISIQQQNSLNSPEREKERERNKD